ncbi:MAG: ABC transporter permease [Bacillota bacterium]|nr:ABC transporter permease [Bacillota bacterium]
MDVFKRLYQYREFIKTNVKKDIRGKYKGSYLGVLWSFLNPLLQVVVYWIVFPYLLRGASIPNYLLYLVTGIVPWNYFITSVTGSTVAIKGNGPLLKKVYFPREILIISQILSGLVNFFISCLIVLLFAIITGAGISWHIVFVPLVALIQSLLSLGIGFICGSINVYIQDLENIVPFILNMAFYGTPILYSLEQFSSAGILAKLVSMNPLTTIIYSYRDIFLYHQVPNFTNLSLVFLLAFVLCIIGLLVFKKLEKGFAEQL